MSASALDHQVGGDHYSKLAIQPAEFIERNGLSFLEGCVIKRICRHRSKNGREDLEKAKHEIDLMIQFIYGSGASHNRDAARIQFKAGETVGVRVAGTPEWLHMNRSDTDIEIFDDPRYEFKPNARLEP